MLVRVFVYLPACVLYESVCLGSVCMHVVSEGVCLHACSVCVCVCMHVCVCVCTSVYKTATIQTFVISVLINRGRLCEV